jgi:hypothetical protein
VQRPNIILTVTDDQGDYHYGSAKTAHSTQSGQAVPAPITPNMDLLSQYGTAFPIAHNAAAWCLPSLDTMITGRHQRSFVVPAAVTTSWDKTFLTVPEVLRSLGKSTDPVLSDPTRGNVTGGYCSVMLGKAGFGASQTGFHAQAGGSSQVGRISDTCTQSGTAAPRCGTGAEDYGADTSPSVRHNPVGLPGNMGDLFKFIGSLIYPHGNPVTYSVTPFFAWYAPHVPHWPCLTESSSKGLEIMHYLFGSDPGFSAGVFQLGANSSLHSIFVNEKDTNDDAIRYYSSVWMVDDELREIRKFLVKARTAQCIGTDGPHWEFQGAQSSCVPSARSCPGCAWFNGGIPADASVSLEQNTVLMVLSDNGWFEPNAKHRLRENGYRTRLIVFDPTRASSIPSWSSPPVNSTPRANTAVAHAADLMPTIVGYAMGTDHQSCPQTLIPNPNGGVYTTGYYESCDGLPLQRQLYTSSSSPPDTPDQLRGSLCAHQTVNEKKAEPVRYLVTRPGTVGRCYQTSAATCSTPADCSVQCVSGQCPGGGQCNTGADCVACIEGRCTTARTNWSMAGDPNSPTYNPILAAREQVAPPCTVKADCDALLPTDSYDCGAKGRLWCRSNPNIDCTADSTVCSASCTAGQPCDAVCESHVLKLYVGQDGKQALTDLLYDPDEVSPASGADKKLGILGGLATNSVAKAMTIQGDGSHVTGGYQTLAQGLNCCLDNWWLPVVGTLSGVCSSSNHCPTGLSCPVNAMN